jgi:hypothetical protein
MMDDVGGNAIGQPQQVFSPSRHAFTANAPLAARSLLLLPNVPVGMAALLTSLYVLVFG